MFSKWFPRNKGHEFSSFPSKEAANENPSFNVSPLAYNWIKSGRLAIGPMPKSRQHWQQLENDNFNQRFSCCYPHEHIFSPIPSHWLSREVSLPDHRGQEDLKADTLIYALREAKSMIDEGVGPLYIHCFAGQERSVLIAIGLVCILDNKDLFDSLNHIRSCHQNARPIYSQLDLLDQLLKDSSWYS